MALVSVQHGFEYKARDGRLVSIRPNESYILVCKTNEHWWHVRREPRARPFYVPAQYVKELTPRSGGAPGSSRPDAADAHRFSTFGFGEDADAWGSETGGQRSPVLDQVGPHSPTGGLGLPLTSAPLRADGAPPHPPARPVPELRDGREQSGSVLPDVKAEQLQTAAVDDDDDDGDDDDIGFPSPPRSPIYHTIPEISITDFDAFPEPPSPAAPEEQVENENIRSAVYVNVAQLRQSISESPPSAPSSYSPSYLDPEGWEVHVDQDSGQEYYYHPATRRTTWDNPFLDSPQDLEPPAEHHCFPSPPQSPGYSPSTASPPAWPSDWEQLVDETSGCTYYYNTMSGETSWEPPEQQSPYPSLMEPVNLHGIQEDSVPPLPKEDYPAASQPEAYSELRPSGPPTLPKDFPSSLVSRTSIPRANLDRSIPAGWNLNVEPNGTWVFTREHSSEQWIKSVDDRGKTYYYLRDGSKSQWSLPEAPVASGQSRVENGEAESASVFKNWRHTMGPAQFALAQDDGRFVPTHRRNTSDYSSDSSSTGNSPEAQPNVQTLEKAGILNKTKVSENGKKVRKNWAQTWTVLRGGVLTFHKDPKSVAAGASNKTNQIVPEVTVELRGATIGRAPKDKSSKKNVLELKSKNGMEFLIQYDTETIISDWYKVLMDTIRQLEYQDHHSEEEDGDLYEKIPNTERDDKSGAGGIDKRRPSKQAPTPSTSSVGDTDQKKVRTKLMKFLMKRPTLQSVKEKGYIRENVFGCHLATLCAHERTTVPNFVEKCVKAVERRGLDIDGLYRVSGNLAVIQKLRFKADHEELDLDDGQWEDVHVIAGALKLFFRELPEPLFPFSHFNDFITAIRIPDYKTKLSCMCDLVESLPPANHDTMKLLFGHLCRVIQFGEVNRMTVQNVAIVFGPTLLRPEMESANIAMHMVFQNQIVEFVLNEYRCIFNSC